MNLPRCETTDLPRLMCACPEHSDSFTMTEDERAFVDGQWPADRLKPEPRRIVVGLPEYRSQPWGVPVAVKVNDSDNPCRVAHCTRPAPDAFVCAQCVDDLEVVLGDMPSLCEDLLILLTKQQRFSGQGGGKDRSPLPFVPKAGEMLHEVQNALSTAARALAEHRGLSLPMTIQDAATASRWLLTNVAAIALDPAGPDVVAELVHLSKQARRLIDRPEGRIYIGLCAQCQTPMHASAAKPEHRCTTCGTEYVVEDCRRALSERVRSRILTLRELSDLSAAHFGGFVSVKQLEGLVRRRAVYACGTKAVDGKQVKTYPGLDVAAILDQRRADVGH